MISASVSRVNPLLEELQWRGMIAATTDREALDAHLSAGPVTSYVGFDPTAPSIHIGNLVQLLVVQRLQKYGHRPLLLVGGATGLIGDPKMTGERKLNDRDIVAAWVDKLKAQVSRFVDMDGSSGAKVVNNYDWLSKISALDYLREYGKYFAVNRMLNRDVVARRLESGISYTEFSYVLLQSIDFLELYRRQGCTLQTGAQDQWGNITAGAELIRRSDRGIVHGLVTPLLTKADGTKYGKSETGTIWLDRDLTPPYAFHQFFLHAEDTKVIDYLKVFSNRSADEIAQLELDTRDRPHLRLAQHALADDITDIVHSVKDRQDANKAAQALFGRSDFSDLDAETLAGVVDSLDLKAEVCGPELPTLVDAMALTGVVASKSAARRAISDGGAYLNNVRVDDPEYRLTPADLLADRYVFVRRGKKTVGAIAIK